MSANDSSTATTAIERARLAYEQMKRRQYDAIAQKRARDRSRNIKLAASAAGMIAFFVGFAIYNASPPPDPLRSATEGANQADNSKFGETRTAPIRSFVKGNTCQEIHFNNDAGTYARGALVPCVNESSRDAAVPAQPSSSPPPSPSKGPRINAIRDGFR
jgi:hypothetical protein